MSSNVLLSPADDRDFPVSAFLDQSLNELIPDEFEVWQPPTIENQQAGSCTAQAIINIIECLVYQLYGVHLEHSVGYTYATPLNTSNLPGIEPRTGFKSVLKEGVMLREAWECDDENPVCREKRMALPEKIHKLARKYIKAYVRINTKEEMQRYMLQYGLPVLAVAPMRAFSFGSGYHAVAVYGWVTQETARRDYVYMEDRDLRYTNSWGAWNPKGLLAFEQTTEMWGVIPKEQGEDEKMRGTEHLHPELQVICEKFLNYCQLAGLNVKITDTLRTKAEQDALYAQGRTTAGSIVTNVKYPNSAHNWGVAFDICQNIKGREYDDSGNFFAKCGKIGESLGLTWGGSWKSFQDKPHFELKRFMPDGSTKWLRETYGDPAQFMETWESAKEEAEVRYKYLTDVPADSGFRDIIAELMERGIIKGMGNDGKGEVIDLSYDMLRMIVFLYRAGVFNGR